MAVTAVKWETSHLAAGFDLLLSHPQPHHRWRRQSPLATLVRISRTLLHLRASPQSVPRVPYNSRHCASNEPIRDDFGPVKVYRPSPEQIASSASRLFALHCLCTKSHWCASSFTTFLCEQHKSYSRITLSNYRNDQNNAIVIDVRSLCLQRRIGYILNNRVVVLCRYMDHIESL